MTANANPFPRALGGALIAIAVAGAQEPAGDKDRQTQKIAEYTTTSRMLSAPIYLEASADDKAEAQREGEQAKRPKAKITEWLVNAPDGTLAYAVVSIGGFLGIGDKTVLVPADQLRWNNALERYDLGWTKDQLKAHHEFDLDAACKTGLDEACPVAAGQKPVKVARDASTGTPAKIEGTSFVVAPCCLAKASALASMPVYAGNTEWGKTKDLIVDRGQGRVVLAIVNHGAKVGIGGDEYLVAYPHLTCAQKDDRALVMCAQNCTTAQLESCVRFEKPKNGVVDPVAARRALESKGKERDGQR